MSEIVTVQGRTDRARTLPGRARRTQFARGSTDRIASVQGSTSLSLTGSAPPAGVDPESLASLVEYLDARDLAATYSDGDLVPTWAAGVAGGANATQASTAEQPRYRATGIGTGPAVDLDGTDDNLLIIPGIASTTHTLQYLISVDTLSGSQRLVDCQTGRLIAQILNTGEVRVLSGGGGWRSTGVILSTATAYILTLRMRGADSELDVWLDRTERTTVTYSPVDHRSTTRFGSGVGADREWLDGKIGLFAAYDAALTDTEIQDTYDYIAAAWGI